MVDCLPRTYRDLFRPSAAERLLFGAALTCVECTGLWRYPIRAEGDLERMTLLDKLYWLYKTTRPIARARRGSELEAFFAAQESHGGQLPDGFRVDRELVLSAAGDLLPNEYLARSGDGLYAAVADLLFGADVAMANLESALRPTASQRIDITTRASAAVAFDPESFAVARGHAGRGFTFLATANNHSLDFGAEGVDLTARLLADAGIAFHGTNPRGTDPASATVLRRGDIALGVVSFTFGLNANRPPADRPDIVNRMNLNGRPEELDLDLLERQLHACAAAGVDFVVAQLHWGMEHELYPTPEQVAVAHCLAERGVDAIIGHHPHVVQPVEYYRTRRDPARIVPIYYSLGNLINPCTARYLCHSRVARIAIAKGSCGNGPARTYVARATTEDVILLADEARRTVSVHRLDEVNSRRSA